MDIILLTRQPRAPYDLSGEFIQTNAFEQKGLKLFSNGNGYMVLDTTTSKLYEQIGKCVFLEVKATAANSLTDMGGGGIMDKITNTLLTLDFVEKWFLATPIYPYAKTREEEKSFENTLAKADIAWRLCSEAPLMLELIHGMILELNKLAAEHT